MFDFAHLLLQRIRTIGTKFFHRFGIHCATHQIRVILISCVVITSLFYPALAIYSSSQPRSLSILDTFVAPDTISSFQQDLANIWSGYETLRVREDAVSRARCGVERTLRVERILIQSPFADDHRNGALNHQTLLETLHLERRIEELVSSRALTCLKRPDLYGTNMKCFSLSPLLFWSHDENRLLSDSHLLDTLLLSKNVSVAGIPVTPAMVLSSRGSNEHHVAGGTDFDYAMFLALTYFFPETDCLGNWEHTLWLQALEDAIIHGAQLAVQAQEPTLIALEYDPKLSRSKGWSAISTFLYLAYAGFFAYVTWSMRRMDAVHSRIGLTFTALVEIAVSTVTSLSVCALVGFKVTMVPWGLLPIVIVFVGAENMFNLVDAVGKTSVTIPVKERIAEGLGHAGTSNTLKVVSYNAILGVISVFAGGAIRQFCVFAIVVLVAHWFLAHTFFMAVLSIDIQRLELEELLRQNSTLVSAAPGISNGTAIKQPRSRWHKVALAIQNLLRGRATKNFSLLLLLAITATLYYTTYPSSTRIDESSTVSPSRNAFVPSRSNLSANALEVEQHQSPAWHIWKTFNLKEDPLLHLRIEVPAILTFMPDIEMDQRTMPNTAHRTRFSMRSLRLIVWLFKIVVLPIAATTSALWGLLLYLLKNAELLEAQRNRPEPDSLHEDNQTTLEESISFSTLPRAFPTDVELIAASKNGQVVVSVSLQNEVVIWRMDNGGSHINLDIPDVLLRAASTSSTPPALATVAVDGDGKFCAVGTGTGIIAVWAISKESVEALPHLSLDNLYTGVLDLQFLSTTPRPSDLRKPPFADPSSPSGTAQEEALWLVAAYDSGLVAKWTIGTLATVTYLTPSHKAKVVKSTLLRVHPEERLLAAFYMNDGTLELTEVQDSDPLIPPDFCVQVGDSANVVSKTNACRVDLGGQSHFIIGVATEAGSVSLWDGSTGECFFIFDDTYGTINHLRISPIPCGACHYCGELPLESFSVAFSVGHVLRLFKAYISVQNRRCSCAQNQPRRKPSWDTLGRRSRTNSITSSVPASPSMPRSRLTSAFEVSPFPVSGHGVHSRRASEKDLGRRSSDVITQPFSKEDHEPNHTVALTDGSRIATGSPSSFWQSLFVVQAADVTCERGSWNVLDRRIIGVRRRPRRSQGKTRNGLIIAQTNVSSSQGLTLATLERWELWIFDLSVSRFQCTPLAALTTRPDLSCFSTSKFRSSNDCIPRLPFTRIFPILITRRFVLAGFGNTVGVFDLTTS